MKMAKTLYLLLIVAVMFLAVSCSDEVNIERLENNTPQVVYTPDVSGTNSTIQIPNSFLALGNNTIPSISPRSIGISVDSTESNIAYFRYRFIPQWTDDHEIEGDSNGWQTTTDFPTEWSFNFEQGKWSIEIEIYDERNNKLGDTFSEVKYMNKLDNSLCSGFYEWLISTGTGSIHFGDIIIPKIYELPSHYEMAVNSDSIEVKNYYVTWALMQGSTSVRNGTFELRSTNSGLATFGDVTVGNIPVGNYILALSIKEGLTSTSTVTSGGEVSDISIFRNCTTNITASVNTTDFIHCTFRAKQNETGYTGKIRAQYQSGKSNATLTLVAENATDVKWYQNGVYKPGYGNGTVANVTGISSGAAGAGLIGTSSNYFDCTFTNSETGVSSSCSYILVAGGSWGGSNTDGSIFTVNTGNEISRWEYRADAIDALGDSFGEGNGTASSDAYFDERKWTINATAYNSSGRDLGSGTFVGYINKTTQFIDVPLEDNLGKGWMNIGSIASSRNLNSGSYSNRTLSWKITNVDTSQEITGNTSISGNTSTSNWTFNPNQNYELDSGTYVVELTTSCYHSPSGLNALARGTYYGHCIVIVNIYKGVTTIVQGSLTTDGRS